MGRPTSHTKDRKTEWDPCLRRWFLDENAEMDTRERWIIFSLQCDEKALSAAWCDLRDDVLNEFVRAHPGRRPWCWWALDRPGLRLRLSGVGDVASDFLGYTPAFKRGIPVRWVSKFDEQYYNGCRRDVNGRLIESKHRPGNFKGRAIDPENPPTFESQAAFLQRHGLLMPGEAERLVEADFVPEVVLPNPEDE